MTNGGKLDAELRETFRTGKNTLVEALFAVQSNAPKLQKDSINPHFKNKYISLEDLMGQILPLLADNKLLLIQSPTQGDQGEPTLTTTIIHVPTGDVLESTMALVLDRENPQGQGSAITYARRYSLMAILGLVADVDDDGNAGSKPRRKSKRAVQEPDDDGDTFDDDIPF